MALICLPYVTFNYWHAKARLIIVLVASAMVVLLLTAILLTFYSLQPLSIGVLQYLNCISFIPKSAC